MLSPGESRFGGLSFPSNASYRGYLRPVMAESEHYQLNIWQQPGDTETRTAVALASGLSFPLPPWVGRCFNRCCREATLILSPYDILRLSRRLGMATGDSMKRYTRREVEAGSGLPLVLARPAPSGGFPFLGEAGCTGNTDRPAACRLFPLAQGSELTPQGVRGPFFSAAPGLLPGVRGDPEWTAAAG